jgi:hypothetical protein
MPPHDIEPPANGTKAARRVVTARTRAAGPSDGIAERPAFVAD